VAVLISRSCTQYEVNTQTIRVRRKNDVQLQVTCYQSNGSTVRDISGGTVIKFTVVNKATGALVHQETLAGGGITLETDGTDGIFNVALADTDLDLAATRYDYDLEYTDSGAEIETIATGDLQISEIYSDAT